MTPTEWLDSRKWLRIDEWTGESISLGTLMTFDVGMPAWDCAAGEGIVMLLQSYRYGVAFEVYGTAGAIAGQHLACVTRTDDGPRHPSVVIPKQWFVRQWRGQLNGVLPALDFARLARSFD